MTNAQERAKELAIDLHYMEHPGGTGKPRFIPDGWETIISATMAQVEAETLEKAAKEAQRRVTQGDLLNIYAESELARLAAYYSQQAQRAKEGTG